MSGDERTALFVIMIVLLAGFFGLGSLVGIKTTQTTAIQRGLAHYNSTNAQFEWKSPTNFAPSK